MNIKTKNILFFSLLSLLVSCTTEITGEGAVVTDTYTPGANFTKVSVDADIDVTITYGTTKKIYVTGYDNLLEYVKLSATGGVLKIGMKPDYTFKNMNLTAVVVMPTFTGLTVTSSGSIQVDSFANTLPAVQLEITGSGNIEALHHPNITSLGATLNGSGSVLMNGFAGTQNLQLGGTGNYQGFATYANYSTVSISGSGFAEVNPKLLLDATISGAGNIYYKRYPQVISHITGTGVIVDSN
jgi:hypothetical protein